jgi:hypothetical protein
LYNDSCKENLKVIEGGKQKRRERRKNKAKNIWGGDDRSQE